jgi:hypothetical protein
LLSARGNDVFLYDETQMKFLKYTGTIWELDAGGVGGIGSTGSHLVKVTGLRQKNLIIDLMSTTGFASILYSVSGTTATKVT